jgi:putative transcriptional regulator
MSLRKLYFFAALATVVTLTTVGTLDVQTKKIPISQSHYPVAAFDESISHMGQPANKVFGSSGILQAKQKIATTVFLPVQSRNRKDLGVGKLLVASRELGDPNFVETVVLLIRYDAQGVVGLVVNRRTRIPLSRALEGLSAAKDRSDTVYLGGPVNTAAVFALLRSLAKVEGAENIVGDVYLISAKTLFEHTISTQPDPAIFHVYCGYAGWNTVQLQKEVELGAWFIFPADASTVFNSNPDSLWSEMIRKTELKLAKSEPSNSDSRRICIREADCESRVHGLFIR